MEMYTMQTHGVTIDVETTYQLAYSNPLLGEFMFGYRMWITNHNAYPIRLMQRYYDITDSLADSRVLEGSGVVGVQPVISEGGTFEFISGITISSEIGQVTGHYEMVNMTTQEPFKVIIPMFKLIAPLKLN